MPWAKLDDRLHLNPKANAVGAPALRSYIFGITYCAQNMTDGFIARSVMQAVRATPTIASELVKAHMWELADGGYRVHDYLLYQDDRETIEANREKARRQRSDAGKASAAQRKRQRASNGPFNENTTEGQPDSYTDPYADPPRSSNEGSPPPARELALEIPDEPTWAIAEAWLGRKPSKTESVRLADGIADYGDELVKFAIQTAKDGGKRDMTYMLRICQGHQQSGVPKESANANRTRNGGSRTGFRVSAEEAQRNAELFANAKANGKVVE